MTSDNKSPSCCKSMGKTTYETSNADDDAPSEEEQRLRRNAEILRMMPDNIADALAKARAKPIWCSDTRWRMELKRRRSSRFVF